MMNEFSAARERKALDMAVVKFIAGGGKVTKIAPIYRTDRELNRHPAADVLLRVNRSRRASINLV